MSWSLRIAAIVLVLLCGLAPVHATAQAVDISGDDASDQFVGSGSSAGSSGGGASPSRPGRGCSHCIVMASDPCSSQYNTIGCGRVTEGCPAGQEQRRMWYSPDDGHSWEDLGLRCVGGRPEARIDPVAQQVHDAFARAVPPAHITVQPSQGILPQVPTLFDSGQPAALDPSAHMLGGVQVILRPVARWHWDFGDGASLDTQSPGSRFPDLTVSHIYRTSGGATIRLRTTWTASYTLDGAGPFLVDGAITQESSLRIEVGQGRAVLA